jgi:hypothetical protein
LDRIVGAIALECGAWAQEARRAEAKDTGSVRLQDGPVTVVADLPRRVDCDEAKFATLVERIRADDANPSECLDVYFSIFGQNESRGRSPPIRAAAKRPANASRRERAKPRSEAVRHERDASEPKPLRKRWHEYPKQRPSRAMARTWSEPIIGVVDRTGRKADPNLRTRLQPKIEEMLIPQVAPDAMLLSDGAPQYEAIAGPRGLSFKVLVADPRAKRMPKAYHLNSANGLHARRKDHFCKRLRGPATKCLDGHARGMVARRDGDSLTIFRSIIDRSLPTRFADIL